MFTAARPALASSLSWIARILPSKPSQPVLAGIRLTVADGTLTASGMDFEQSAAVTLDVDGDDLDVVVSGRLLADLVKAIDSPTVEFAVNGNRLSITGGRSKFVLPLMITEDYPTLPAVPPAIGSVAGSVFADAARQITVAAADDSSLPILGAVYLETDPEKGILTLAATDRYRMATTTVPYTPEVGAEPEVFLVPAKVLDSYGKTYADSTVVTLHHGGDDTILFGVTGEGRTSTTRLIDGQFPDFRRHQPTEFTANATVSVADLVGAVRRVSLVAERENSIRLTVGADGEMTVSVGATGAQDQAASEAVDVAFDSEDEFEIAFNYGYLLGGLNNLDSVNARIRFTGPGKAALLCSDDEHDPYRYLLMPVRI